MVNKGKTHPNALGLMCVTKKVEAVAKRENGSTITPPTGACAGAVSTQVTIPRRTQSDARRFTESIFYLLLRLSIASALVLSISTCSMVNISPHSGLLQQHPMAPSTACIAPDDSNIAVSSFSLCVLGGIVASLPCHGGNLSTQKRLNRQNAMATAPVSILAVQQFNYYSPSAIRF